MCECAQLSLHLHLLAAVVSVQDELWSEMRFVIRIIDDIMLDVLFEYLASYSQNMNPPPNGTRRGSAWIFTCPGVDPGFLDPGFTRRSA